VIGHVVVILFEANLYYVLFEGCVCADEAVAFPNMRVVTGLLVRKGDHVMKWRSKKLWMVLSDSD
jgi:hypothetical protein